MNVLSLFDGISCARLALDRLCFEVENYFASEIDPHAIEVSKANWPDIKHLRDVREVGGEWHDGITQVPPVRIDLLIGGSPCQDLSIAKRGRKGLIGKRSSLFWQYARILKETKPKYFVLENVASMPKEAIEEITKELGVEPILIDAALVSAQNRRRLFWTNIPGIIQPADRSLSIRDVVWWEPREEVIIKVPLMKTERGVRWDVSGKGYFSQQDRAYHVSGKFPTIPTSRTITKMKFLDDDGKVRQLTWEDIEVMQGLPRGYTKLIWQKEKRGGVIGNAFNVDVIAHILSFIQ